MPPLSKLYCLFSICTNDSSKGVKYIWWWLQGDTGLDGGVNNEEEKVAAQEQNESAG